MSPQPTSTAGLSPGHNNTTRVSRLVRQIEARQGTLEDRPVRRFGQGDRDPQAQDRTNAPIPLRNILPPSLQPPSQPKVEKPKSVRSIQPTHRAPHAASPATISERMTPLPQAAASLSQSAPTTNPEDDLGPDDSVSRLPLLRSQLEARTPSPPARSSSGPPSEESERARDIPAYEVFARHASPLHLPELDKLLDSISTPNFTETESVLGPEEVKAWREHLKPKKSSWVHRIASLFSRAASKEGIHDDDEKDIQGRGQQQSHQSAGPEEALPWDKTAAFLPGVFLPDHLTLAKLKLNKHSASALVTTQGLLGTAVDAILGYESSRSFSDMHSVEMFRDMVQTLSLLLTFSAVGSSSAASTGSASSVGKVSQILGLDFISAFGKAILWFWVFLACAAWAVWEFTVMTGGLKRGRDLLGRGVDSARDLGEGFDRGSALRQAVDNCNRASWIQRLRQSRGYRIAVVFIATTLYMPLSKVCIGALVWSSDFWAVDNPYQSLDEPRVSTTGTASRRAPNDFCYTTTMLKQDGLQHFNWAWVIVPTAAVAVLWLTIYFPLRLWFAVRQAVPHPDPYTEFGAKRQDMQSEYQRQLGEDQHPLAFLYIAYRRPWCGFKSIYMVVKLVNVVALQFLSKDNCLFRHVTRAKMEVASQGVQLVIMVVFLSGQLYANPFIDRPSNNSDWASRVGYVFIALFGLLVALELPGKAALESWAPSIITSLIYALSIWFTLVSKTFFQSWIKILQRRLDFSIDIFSPYLDTPKHVTRRIWQEAICTILLATPSFSLPKEARLQFAREPGCAPYLLAFRGTQAERVIENIKILRDVGLTAYTLAVEELEAPRYASIRALRKAVAQSCWGPDMLWISMDAEDAFTSTGSYFGRSSITPFPFQVTFRYDQRPNQPCTLKTFQELERLLELNSKPSVIEARHIRRCLRALEGQTVYWPHTEERFFGESNSRWLYRRFRSGGGGGYVAQQSTSYSRGILNLERNSAVCFNGHNFNSGFRVSIEYKDGSTTKHAPNEHGKRNTLRLPGSQIGITESYTLTPTLARFFSYNKTLVSNRLPGIDMAFHGCRTELYEESLIKNRVLSYGFLLHVMANDKLSLSDLTQTLNQDEDDSKMKRLTKNFKASFTLAKERVAAVDKSRVSQAWFLFWDDLWRCNNASVRQIRKHPHLFSPQYRTSLCYHPRSRGRLEALLKSVHLAGATSYFTPGILNRLYLHLNQTAFSHMQVNTVPIEAGHRLVAPQNLPHAVNHRGSSYLDKSVRSTSASTFTVATGDGTNEDASEIRERPAFPYEEVYTRAAPTWSQPGRRAVYLLRQAGRGIVTWLGLTHLSMTQHQEDVTFLLRQSRDGYLQLPMLSERINHKHQ